MNITNKPVHDPASDLKMPDAHFRSALLAAEEVAGKQGMAVVLRNAGLEQLIDHYPPESNKISGNYSFGDYASLNAALLTFFGRGGQGIVKRIGRAAFRLGFEQFNNAMGSMATAAVKLLPEGVRVQRSLDLVKIGFEVFYKQPGGKVLHQVEDRGERVAYSSDTCSICAGKQSDENMCHLFSGFLVEGLVKLFGKEYSVMEVECRAKGAPACVWEISKFPKE
jgi:predicted hydrocarbon binding protein